MEPGGYDNVIPEASVFAVNSGSSEIMSVVPPIHWGTFGGVSMSRQSRGPHCALAVGYVRVSTSEQAREGVSLDAQRARIAAHCQAKGWSLAHTYADEGISGRKASNRPGLEAAIRHVCEVKGSLIVYSLSRLARSTKDAILISERLSRADAEMVLLSESVDTTTASGRMFYAVLAALAAFESELIGERTKLALDHKKAKGERYCLHAPYGFRFNCSGKLVPHPTEAKSAGTMRRLAARGESLRKIAACLPELGVLNRSGKPFNFAQVGEIVRRLRTPVLPPRRAA